MDPIDPHIHVVGAGNERSWNARASSYQCVVSRVIVAGDKPASEPRNCSNAGAKSEDDRPCRYNSGNTSTTRGDFRDQAGKSTDANRFRSPVTGSVRLSLIRGARTRHRTRRGGHLPGGMGTVADHQPTAVDVDLVTVAVDICGDLGLQRRREHLPGTVADNLI